MLICFALAWSQVDPSKKVMITFSEAMPHDVFGALGRGMNYVVSLDQKVVTRPVTILGRLLTQQTALDAICESIDCRWHAENGRLLVEPLSEGETSGLRSRSTELKSGLDERLPSNMRFEKVPLKQVLEDVFTSQRVGYLLYGEALSERRLVTIDVSNQKVSDALVRILENAGVGGFKIMQTFDESPSAYYISVPAKPKG
jgi:hypothetical protein